MYDFMIIIIVMTIMIIIVIMIINIIVTCFIETSFFLDMNIDILNQ